MKWSTTQLLKFRGKSIPLDETVNIEQALKEKEPQVRRVSSLQLKGNLSISAEKVTFHMNISGELILPCSRTLKDVPFPIDIDSIETFLLKPNELYLPGEDEEIHQPEQGMIDLEPSIIELLILEIPMQVFSEDVSDMNISLSGNDWELMEESDEDAKEVEKEKPVDPRLAGLAKFFDQQES